MKEWILENTTVTEERYDSLINANTVSKNRKIEHNIKINFKNPLYHICNFTLKKPSKLRCKFYNIKKEGNFYLYKDLKFRVLAETLFDRKEPYAKELYSIKRVGTCFQKSLDFGCNLKNNNIFVAMCDEPFIIPTEPFLHAFVCGVEKMEKNML